MWFRVFWLVVAVSLWSIAIWLATHSSSNVDVFSRYSNEYFLLLASLFLISFLLTFLQFGSAYQRVYRKRHSLILLVSSSVFCLVCLEILVRILDPIGISYYEHANNYHLDKIADDELYYRHKSYLDRIYQGVSVKTNVLGMRDESISKKESRELRIVFLGDSVTFGWGVREENIFVRGVGEILEKELDRPVRTINTGVGSYNTANEHAVLSRYGEILKPDLVVLMYVSNDIEIPSRQKFDPRSGQSFQRKSPPQVIKLVLGKSWTYRLISHLGRSYETTNLNTSSNGWKQSVNALQGISDYCNSHNIPLFVFMYRMVPGELENDISRELNMLSSKMNFFYGDVLPWFKDLNVRLLRNTAVDGHPNAQGHAVLADGIANVIVLKNLFSSR